MSELYNTKIGVVIIGRNEGDRLRKSIQSVDTRKAHIVYVDSGSTDGSVGLAQSLGSAVVELDMNQPFTAGRGRNAGFKHLLDLYPAIEFVQFIDGDCILDPQWIDKALAKMQSNAEIAVVCGRRRELHPEASVYNKLCDMEWDTPIGEAEFCGGDALLRTTAFQQVNGYDPSFAAGEEPELCYRLRQNGWRVWRIDAEMVLHDADMTRFSQWWKRTMRSGSAYAQNAYVHWKDDGRFWFRESVSIWIWGFFIPLALLLLAPFTAGLTLLGGVSLYVFQAYRVYKYRRGFHEDTHEDARLYATYCVLGKFPQMVGQLKFLSKRESALIEYKSPETTVKPAKITPSEPISSSNGHTSTLEKQFFAETKTEVTEPIDEA